MAIQGYSRILSRGAVLATAAGTLVVLAAGASSAGTRVTAPSPQTATVARAAAATAGTAAAAGPHAIRPQQINQFCDYTSAEPQIGYGSTGVAVEQAQCELDSVVNGPIDIAVDGIFGPQTKAFTMDFQGCAGIRVDGIIGPQTWAALDAWSDKARSCG
jgi:lysozyme